MLESFDSIFPTFSTFFHPTPCKLKWDVEWISDEFAQIPRRTGIISMMTIDPNQATLDCGAHPMGPREVAGPYSSP